MNVSSSHALRLACVVSTVALGVAVAQRPAQHPQLDKPGRPGPLLEPAKHSNTDDPLSSLVAITTTSPSQGSIPGLVKQRVREVASGSLPGGVAFPLANTTDDTFRTLDELQHNLVVAWLDPLVTNPGASSPRFGANCDYVAYFGLGWDDGSGGVVGRAPQFNGAANRGYMWVNHEYISNSPPTTTSAPNGQALTLAQYLASKGVLTNDVTANVWSKDDVDTYDRWSKREIGGSWFEVWQDPSSREWRVVLNGDNRRYDATADTLSRIVGYRNSTTDHGGSGDDLPRDVVAGILGDCSGAQTPWGTIITAEENVQDYYGDLETAWTSSQRLIPNAGFDAGANIRPEFSVSRSGDLGRISNVTDRHNRDNYGHLTEIDPLADASHYYTSLADGGDGAGHRKIGAMGRARWENAAIAVEADFELADGKRIVIYGGDDRRSGRIWKWVSNGAYTQGMTRAQVRQLIDEGSLYAAHFDGLDHATGITMASTGLPPTEQNPGIGQWIHVSVNSTDVAPNAAALGEPGKTVGDALRDVEYNRIGGFPTDNDVRCALFTVANKLGIKELNRPEDIEWNPLDPSGTPRLYVAFTNHNRQVALTQDGVVYDPAQHAAMSPSRTDRTGSIFAMQEQDAADPAASTTFTYFMAWQGTNGAGPNDASCPDNIMIDADGGVWFGTDGNFGVNGTADALYYLDLDPMNQQGQPGVSTETYGKAFRVAAVPSDAECTGPAFNSDMTTIFAAVQHPGESFNSSPSQWPPRK